MRISPVRQRVTFSESNPVCLPACLAVCLSGCMYVHRQRRVQEASKHGSPACAWPVWSGALYSVPKRSALSCFCCSRPASAAIGCLLPYESPCPAVSKRSALPFLRCTSPYMQACSHAWSCSPASMTGQIRWSLCSMPKQGITDSNSGPCEQCIRAAESTAPRPTSRYWL